MIIFALLFILIGALAGLLAGMLGIGGGMVTIPTLFFIFSYLSPDLDMHYAVGTSLAAMVFNTFASTSAHYRRKSIHTAILWPMLPGALVGCIIGAYVGKLIPSEMLKVGFGLFAIYVGIRFLREKHKEASIVPIPQNSILNLFGLGIGLVSSLLGIGGGLMTVPLLSRYAIPMKKVIGTSAAFTLAVTCVGAISYLFFGKASTQLTDTIGLVYLPAFLGIALASFPFAILGVRLAHHLPTHLLKKIFGVVLIMAGALMLT